MIQESAAERANAYVEHQASKGLASLAVPIERTGADWNRCLATLGESHARFTLVSGLREEDQLHQTSEHPAFGDLNLTQWITFQRIHSKDHIQQEDEMKADAAFPVE